MDNIARAVLKAKIGSLKATYFQDGLDKIFHTVFGSQFTQIKQKRDKGADGILYGNTIVAAYAPETYSLVDFKKKIRDDFQSYEKHWKKTHQHWLVVCNLELTSSMKQFVSSLKADAKTLCVEGLIELIRKQTWTNISLIFKALDIPEHYLSNNILNTVIEDLINISDKKGKTIPYEKPSYIEDKVHLNLEKENIDLFITEYEEYLAYFTPLSQIAKAQESKNMHSLRSTIRATYMGLAGDFSQKLNTMSETLSGLSKNDQYYRLHMRIVLVYFFEQCLFGKKPPSELQS